MRSSTRACQLDPGKGGGLYVLALHWYSAAAGTGEYALRAFSAVFAIVSLILVYALARELFGAETALLAAALWAFNPLLLIVARWARMYSMFIALTLGSLLAMRKLQRRPTAIEDRDLWRSRRGCAVYASRCGPDSRGRGGDPRA